MSRNVLITAHPRVMANAQFSGGGKWEKVGKGGRTVTNKQKTHKNVTKETDKSINGSHLVLEGMLSIIHVSAHDLGGERSSGKSD